MSTKDSILEALRDHDEGFLSGERLSAELNISRAAVWKAISSLRAEGYTIRAVTNKGYRLIESGDVMSCESIRSFLPAAYRDLDITVYETVDSTNTKAKQAAAGKVRHGTVVASLQQTAGRGRSGRSFFSPRSGIYMSIILRPDYDLSRSILLTAAAAAAVSESIEEVCGIRTGIKWVNDIYLDGKKICGILTEGMTDFETGRIDTIITGIGINTDVSDFPAELKEIAGALEGSYSKSELAASIISKILSFTEDPESRAFIDSYRSRSIVTGKDITVFKGRYRRSPEDEIEGIPARALDIDRDGGLIVRYSDGSEETLSTGEISIRA